MENRSIHAGILLPHVIYRSVPDACAWLARVFSFAEHYRYGSPVSGAQMRLGDAYIQVTGPRDWGKTPAALGHGTQMLTDFVDDVDAHYARSKQERAIVWEDLHETVSGERQFGTQDLDGHRWLFSQHIRDVNPEEWRATVSSSLP